jgi:iron complex transport system substrate-binding protein
MAFGGKGVGPWIADEFTTDPKILGTMDLSIEDVIALDPDLILWTRSDNTQPPTTSSAPSRRRSGRPRVWHCVRTTVEQQTELVAKALGKEAEGKALLSGLDAKFDAAIAANPSFAGKTAAVGALQFRWLRRVRTRRRTRRLHDAPRLHDPTAITEKATGNFYIPVANENLNLFDADLTVLFPIFLDSSALRTIRYLRAIPSARRDIC